MSRTVYSPATTDLTELDFEIPCKVKAGAHFDRDCTCPANWIAVLRCGHQIEYCEQHWIQLMAVSPTTVCWTCAVCPPPAPRWHSLGEAIVNSWKIKP